MLTDFEVLQETPFTDQGSVVDLFGNNISIWNSIKRVIERINSNTKAV